MPKLKSNQRSTPKTWVSIEDFKKILNKKLKYASTVDERLALIDLGEEILNDAGANWGYSLFCTADQTMREYY
jgi:hypothetical protein